MGSHAVQCRTAIYSGRSFRLLPPALLRCTNAGTWQQNSRVIHATSETPGGEYKRKDVTWEVFSHEPVVVPSPHGEFVMYFTADLRSPDGLCKCCRPGHGPCDGSTGAGDCTTNLGKGSATSYMSFSNDPNGPWSAPVKLFEDYHTLLQGGDTNFAPVIHLNGSIVGMWRRWGPGNGGSRQYLVTASDWKDPSTYVQHRTELFPDLGGAGTEDQFVCEPPPPPPTPSPPAAHPPRVDCDVAPLIQTNGARR